MIFLMHPLRLLSSLCVGTTIAAALPVAAFSAEAQTAVSTDAGAIAKGVEPSEVPDGRKGSVPSELMVGPAVLVTGRPDTKTQSPARSEANSEPTASAEMPSPPSGAPEFDDSELDAKEGVVGRVARWFRRTEPDPQASGGVRLMAGTEIPNNTTLTLVADNTLVGPVTVRGLGTLDLNSTFQDIGSTFTMERDASLISTGGGGSIAATDFILHNGTINVVLAGSGSLSFHPIPTSSLTLSALNTYQGPTTIREGTLNINSIGSVGGGPSAIGAPGTAANGIIGFDYRGGTLRYTGPTATTDRTISLLGGGGTGNVAFAIIDSSGTGPLTFTSPVKIAAGSADLTLSGTTLGNVMAGSIPDNTSLTSITLFKAGSGSWTLTAPNSYAEATIISAGTLIMAGAGTLGGPHAYVTVNGGMLNLNGTSQTVARLYGLEAGVVGNNASGTQSTLTLTEGFGNYLGTIADHTAGTGTVALVTLSGTQQYLGGSNTYSGGSTISGTLWANGNSALGTGLAQINTGGNLFVNGVTLFNPVAVQGKLTGTGFISQALTLNAGGVVAPGPIDFSNFPANNVGALTVSSFTWDGGGVMNFNLLGPSNSDRLTINGAFIMGSPGQLVFDFQNGGTVFQNYPLLTFNSLVGFTPGDASPFSYTHLTGGLTGSFTLTSTGLFFSTIPEPSTYAAILGGCALAGAMWHRRRLKVK